MNAKHERFVSEYLKDLNATRAARDSGYSAKTASSQGERLLRNAEITRAVALGQARQLQTAELTATRTLEEMRRLAFSDVRELFDEQGNLRAIHTLTSEQSACIASLEVIIKNAKAGDGVTDTVHKIKMWDKTRTLEMLGKHFKILTENIHVTGDGLIERLIAGRKKAAEAKRAGG